MMMSENFYEDMKMPPLFGSTFDAKSIMKRKRGASVTSRLRTASDLEELGLVDLAEKGKLKDYIISGDVKAASALDNFELYGDTNEFKEFIGQIKEGLPNVDIIDGIQFDTINIRPRTNSCRLLSFDSDLNFDLLDDMNDNIYSDVYGLTENNINRESRNFGGNYDDSEYLNLKNENLNDIAELLKKEDIKHRQSSRSFSIQSFESLCDNGLDVDNFNSTSYRKNSLSGYDIDYFNTDANGNARDVPWTEYNNHIFNDISTLTANITPNISDYNQNHTMFHRQLGKDDEVDMSAYDAVALGASKMTTKGNTNKKRANTQKQSHLPHQQNKTHSSNSSHNNSNPTHYSNTSSTIATPSNAHSHNTNNNNISTNDPKIIHSAASSVARKPSLHPSMIISSTSSSSIPAPSTLQTTSSISSTSLSTSLSLPYPPPPGSDMSGFVGVYSPERRRERIQRFFEKRQRRVWTKKVKYDVRKNFADSRIRVKGRFVRKEDEDLLRVLGVFDNHDGGTD